MQHCKLNPTIVHKILAFYQTKFEQKYRITMKQSGPTLAESYTALAESVPVAAQTDTAMQ